MLVVGGCTGHLTGLPRETFTRAARLLQRILPFTAQLHDLSAVHQALAGEVDQAGLGVAPLGQRDGPFAGAAQVVDLPAGVDHAAVDQAGEQRRDQLAGDHRDHGLVQQRRAFRDAPLPDPGPALRVQREGDQVDVGAPLTDLRDGGRGAIRRLGVTVEVLQNIGHEQVAALGAVPIGAVEEPARPAEPPDRLGQLTHVEATETGPNGASRSVHRVGCLQVNVMGPLHHAGAFVVPADQEGRHRQQFEIRGRQPDRLVGE